MVPQPVIDCAENLLNPKTHPLQREQLEERMVNIKNFCEEVLSKTQNLKKRK
jgi:hypothetical protein